MKHPISLALLVWQNPQSPGGNPGPRYFDAVIDADEVAGVLSESSPPDACRAGANVGEA